MQGNIYFDEGSSRILSMIWNQVRSSAKSYRKTEKQSLSLQWTSRQSNSSPNSTGKISVLTVREARKPDSVIFLLCRRRLHEAVIIPLFFSQSGSKLHNCSHFPRLFRWRTANLMVCPISPVKTIRSDEATTSE